MIYKLEFVKISKDHLYAGVGFAGNIYIILNVLTNLTNEDSLCIDMETNECVITQNDLTDFDTKNPWEFYFDQNNENVFTKLNTMMSFKSNLEYKKYMYSDPEKYKDLKLKFFNNFKFKPYLKTIIDQFYENEIKGKITLGVQIRMTDMKHHHNVSGIDIYINKIKQILIEIPEIEQIFISADDNLAIESIKKSILIPIIYHKDMFRADAYNLHLNPYDRYSNERKFHKYILGLEILKEIFALNKCDYFLQADISSISLVSIILSENIKKVYFL